MESQIIDYYNELPQIVNVINKMNEEFEDLQDKYDKIENELDYYKIPKVLYKSKEEWDNKCKEINEMLKKEITKSIVEKEEYREVYNIFNCPESIRCICEKALNGLTKNENLKNDSISKWSYNKSYEMKHNINAFIQGMTEIPCPGMCNEINLSKIIYKNISYQFTCVLDDIPRFKFI